MIKKQFFYHSVAKNKFFKQIILILFLSLFSFMHTHAKERIYLMPYEQNEALKDLINSIANAKEKIDIAIYSFTNKEIAKALRDVSAKGVKINIIYDIGQKTTHNSTIGYLEKFANIHTCLLEGKPAKKGKYNGLMHHKMIIIDNALIGLGSANWSKNAFENNYESLYFTQSQEIIQKANKYYQKMLQTCTPFIVH